MGLGGGRGGSYHPQTSNQFGVWVCPLPSPRLGSDSSVSVICFFSFLSFFLSFSWGLSLGEGGGGVTPPSSPPNPNSSAASSDSVWEGVEFPIWKQFSWPLFRGSKIRRLVDRSRFRVCFGFF